MGLRPAHLVSAPGNDGVVQQRPSSNSASFQRVVQSRALATQRSTAPKMCFMQFKLNNFHSHKHVRVHPIIQNNSEHI